MKRSFYGNAISRKHGQKCCPYGQNGKPLSEETVKNFCEGGAPEWKANSDFTMLTRSFYLKNIYSAVEFLKDLYEMDAMNTKQIPNAHIIDQDIVRVELRTPKLKGLSYKDLELAAMIDSFDFKKYQLVPLEDEKNYKKIIRQIKIEEDNKAIEDEIAATAGARKGKFRVSEFQEEFEKSSQ